MPIKILIILLDQTHAFKNKRLREFSIVVELVANPSIIFMDEPTSDLDARAAAIVMQTVRNTVDTWRTFVCTIYQPILKLYFSHSSQEFWICQLHTLSIVICREISTPTPCSNDLFFPTKYSQPFFMQFKACFWKEKKILVILDKSSI
ncbi:pleiotropic drug resistance subfamily protein, putative [Medicago truncatula]|uniref:Pleiotropic drug resistance subfamily protein, putative n=1 Tax=Medicago truncatula TaxID=3880 RepID=G8A2R4_MEDTR|nr:pleiotropic drug resistance subfamily protein, putative [Medicago truncatula]